VTVHTSGHSRYRWRLFRAIGVACFSHRTRNKGTSRADASGRPPLGKHTDLREYQPLMVSRSLLTAYRYSPSSRWQTTMAVLTTPDCPASRNCEADRSIGSAFRMSYSTPLPEPSTETVQEAGDCVGSRLVSTLPICFREDTNHDSGGTTLAVCETTRRRIDRQCFSLRRSLAHLTPPKRASPETPGLPTSRTSLAGRTWVL
jgi:hypothetical protein